MSFHPDYPIVSGSYRLTDDWVVELPVELNHQQMQDNGQLTRLTYELVDTDHERTQSVYGSLSGHVISDTESIQIPAYFDAPQARSLGYQVIHSLRAVS